jgi:Ca2+-binding RTX toxin-like protein
MVKLIKHDLEFILKQIQIAEAHAAGGDLAELVSGYTGDDGFAQAHLLPYGLRTVDGSYNNLLPGRENWGAADQSFPGIFTPNYLNDADGDSYNFGSHDLNGDGVPDTPPVWYTNNDYGNAGGASGSNPGPGSGTVIDADPRLISNLIVDQTLNNPAAIAAALTHAGASGQPLMDALSEIVNAHTILKAIPAPALGETPSNAYTLAKAALDAKLAEHGVEMDGNTVFLPNVAPDEGLSSPFNGWMTIFGQFFDHGLDLVAKGGNGTVYVPLSPDDPLYVPGGQNYIPLTRVSVDAGADGRLGTADDGPGPKNLTTPWVDQNQTYGSTASKQVFMREYVAGPDGKPIASGLLLEGANGGLATWADIKHQAKTVLGIELTDLNVGNIPLIAADEYGNFIPGANGYPQLVVGMGEDGILGTADDVLLEGNPAAPVSAQGVVLTGHAFLDDIAHAAAPIVNASGVLQADGDSALGYANADGTPGPQGQRGPSAYDNELLDRHFIAGDGRVNENIALTAVHQVFHAEHNRIVEHTKELALESMDRAFINEWLLTDLTDAQFATLTGGDPAAIAALSETLVWDGERLFQVGRFTNEMEYQHLVFEEFGRMMQPDIDLFLFEPSADINPSIAAEFAHVVYRFGHSMLRQDIAVIEMDENGNPIQNDITLFDGFLNPVMYDSLGDAEAASGAIIRGMSRQVGSEIDEFVTDVLRNQLLGIPLDLAAINLARGRDVGTPPLNAAREKFFDETGDTLLKPYESWADFALNLKNPASIINFIAAYGTHESLINTADNPKTVEQLREAATLLVLGGAGAPADRLDFLNATGAYAGGTLGGLNDVDFWIGGLAEKKMAFGGMLGSTFSFVFQMTMENLQDADRFYYLSRTQGLNLLNELENNTFAELVMRNTDLGDAESTALPGNVFSAFEMPTLEMDISKQLDPDPTSDDPFLGGLSQLVERRDANSDGIAEYIRVNSNEHFTIGGTEAGETIIAGGGDDAIWGKGGDDLIEAGYGVDKVFGGEGDDIITNAGTDIGEADFLHGNEGNDVIHGGSGLSLIFGNQGNDFIVTGPDGKEAFAGTGNDFVLGGTGMDFLLGNEGDDWLEGGQRFDTLAGENSELFFNSTIIGHDVLNGGSGDTDYDAESGDDIMFQNDEGIQRSNGMAGFDWGIHKGDIHAANSDLGIPIFETQEAFILRDRFDLVEGLSGWDKDDVLTGRSKAVNTRAELEGTAAIPGPNSPLGSYSNDLLAKNVQLIDGLDDLVAHLGAGIPVTKVVNGETVPVLDENGVQERVIFSTGDASDILLGGGGSDTIKGLAGNDIIDGDRWLNVRIRFVEDGVAYTADGMEGLVYREVDYVNGAPTATAVAQFGGRELDALMFDRTVNPGQLEIVREIVDGDVDNLEEDVAVFTDVRANYTIIRNADGSVTVSHTGFEDPGDGEDANGEDIPEETVQNRALSDGVDRLFNIEVLRFADGDVRFTPPELALHAFDTSDYRDDFAPSNYAGSDGDTAWNSNWVETGDDGSSTNSNGQIRVTNGALRFEDGNGATISRTVDLAGRDNVTLSFSADPSSLDGDDEVSVQFSADGVNFVELDTITGNGGATTRTYDLDGPFTANAVLRFVATSLESSFFGTESVTIDNVTIEFAGPAASPTVDFEATFIENGPAAAIADGPGIAEDSGEIVSARIVLTNAQAGDEFDVPNNLPGDIDSEIDTSVDGQITVILTGAETLLNYQNAIQQIGFRNSSQDPSTVDRIIQVTVSDGVSDSNVATTTINVAAVNDTPNASNDSIITNIAGDFVLPEWALLTNDTDLDGPSLDITGVSENSSSFAVSLGSGNTVNIDRTTTSNRTFAYTVNDGSGSGNATDTANATISYDTNGINGGNGSEIIVGDGDGDTFDGGGGNDIVFAGAGNDTIVWNSGDGRDFVDGGSNTATGDTFQVNGSNQAEDFVVYARANAEAAGITGLKDPTQIVITRDGAVIAELAGIEEIVIDTNGGNDDVTVVGNLNPTDLSEETITINGSEGDDTVNIAALTSAHRILFRSNGGNDTIVGTLRPQDVVELPEGASIDDYEVTTNANGVTTMTSGDHSICFVAPDGLPQFGDQHDDDEDDHDDDHSHHDDDDQDDVVTPPPPSNTATSGDDVLTGGSAANVLDGGSGDDVLNGGSGDDRLNGGSGDDRLNGGSGADVLHGGSGDDVLNGGSGDDVLTGGSGDDVLSGGSGDDIFAFDGDDVITDFVGGEDRIDLSSLGVTADNFGSRVIIQDYEQPGIGYTLVTVRDAANAPMGTVRLDANAANSLTAADFVLASTTNGDAAGANDATEDGDEVPNGSGGDDTPNGESDSIAGGNDSPNGNGANGGNGVTPASVTDPETKEAHCSDPLSYLAGYDDLIQVLGTDTRAALKHFERYGRSEGRDSDCFDALQYIASHDDLIEAYGANAKAGAIHFISHGFAEGRSRDDFDAGQYLANYADLQAAFGDDEELATQHYITKGYAEGRNDDDWFQTQLIDEPLI